MKTLFNEPKTASQAAYVTRIIARAERLEADGYRLVQKGRTKMWHVFKPENENRIPDYKVDMTPNKEKCSCEGFQDDKDCKHRIAVELRIEEEAALDKQAQEESRWWQEAGFESQPLYC